MDSLVSNLAPALEAANLSAIETANDTDKEQIKIVLQLLRYAIEQCAVRKEQIAPLVKALIPTKETPDSA